MDALTIEFLAFSFFEPASISAAFAAVALRMVRRWNERWASFRRRVSGIFAPRKNAHRLGWATPPSNGGTDALRASGPRSSVEQPTVKTTQHLTKPRVSVIMPVYNAQPYLKAAVESITNQSLTDFELIAIDDGSSDGSDRVLQDTAAADPRVHVVHQSHAGIVEALNRGVELAQGEYIARMDQDDIAMPSRLQRQVDFLDCHPDYVLVGSRVMLVDPDGAPICEFARESSHEEIDQAHLELRWAIVHPTVMMRREALLSLGGYRSKYQTLEDLDLFLRLAEIGKVANLPEVLLHYRRHHHSMCTVFRQQQNAIRQQLHREMRERRGVSCKFKDAASRYHAPDLSPLDTHRKWSWQALEAGNLQTARKHSLIVVRRKPFNMESWRLLWCAMRGR